MQHWDRSTEIEEYHDLKMTFGLLTKLVSAIVSRIKTSVD